MGNTTSTTIGADALPVVESLRTMLAGIELDVVTGYTLADAMREGCKGTDQHVGGWGSGESACALSTAMLAATARGYLKG